MNLEDAARKHSEWKVNFFKAIATKAQLDAAAAAAYPVAPAQ